MTTWRAPGSSDSGVTLVELLVVIMLLALMASYASIAFGQIGRLRGIELAVNDEAEADAVADLLRREIASARFLTLTPKPGEAGGIAFLGEAESLVLVTDADSRLETGGLVSSEYGLLTQNTSRALVNYRRVFRPSSPLSDRGGSDAIEILHGVDSLSFRYFGEGEDGKPASWSPSWTRTDTLPLIVEAKVIFAPGTRRRPLIVNVGLALAR